jgi:hypothetical protein
MKAGEETQVRMELDSPLDVAMGGAGIVPDCFTEFGIIFGR